MVDDAPTPSETIKEDSKPEGSQENQNTKGFGEQAEWEGHGTNPREVSQLDY